MARATIRGNCMVTNSPDLRWSTLRVLSEGNANSSACIFAIRWAILRHLQSLNVNAIKIAKYAEDITISVRLPSTNGIRFLNPTILEAVKTDTGRRRRDILPLPEPPDRFSSLVLLFIERFGLGRRRACRRFHAQSIEKMFRTIAAPITPV